MVRGFDERVKRLQCRVSLKEVSSSSSDWEISSSTIGKCVDQMAKFVGCSISDHFQSSLN